MRDTHGAPDLTERIPMPGGGGDVRDPYTPLKVQREQCPVHDISGGGFNARLVLGHDEVVEVLRDDVRFDSSLITDVMGPVMGHTILEMDGQEHLAHRNLVAMAFRPAMLQRWADELIRPMADELIDAFAARGTADLVDEFTYDYPIRVIATLLGMPMEDYPKFHHWAMCIIGFAADYERGIQASRELEEYLAPILADRRVNPRDDVITALVQAEIDGRVLTDEEILPFLKLLMPAGGETTFRATGNLLYAMLTHPDQMAELRADRSLLMAAVEETLRWEPPLMIIARKATTDTEVASVGISTGDMITVCLAAANRDPSFNDNPDVFDIHRPQKQHHSFGTGPHMCLGMHLARLEMRVALEALLDRLPDVRLDPEADDVHIHGMVFRSPATLPVLFTPQPVAAR